MLERKKESENGKKERNKERVIVKTERKKVRKKESENRKKERNKELLWEQKERKNKRKKENCKERKQAKKKERKNDRTRTGRGKKEREDINHCNRGVPVETIFHNDIDTSIQKDSI